MDALTDLLIAALTILTSGVWWRICTHRGTQKPPRWARLEARLQRRCVLCQSQTHTAQEHIRVPQSQLQGREEPVEAYGIGRRPLRASAHTPADQE
jgi:hypothetical protein